MCVCSNIHFSHQILTPTRVTPLFFLYTPLNAAVSVGLVTHLMKHLLTSEVVRSSGLDVEGDGCSDRGCLVSIDCEHRIVLQRVEMDAVPLAVIQTGT